MTKPQQADQARKHLDAKFADGSLRMATDRPVRGWIRAIRDALGMSTRQLAARMGQTQPAITQLEQSEVSGRAQLDSLRRAANALECDLVYALVPRTSLEETVRSRARLLAERDIAAINQTMKLENQALEADELAARIDDYAERLVAEGRLWDDAHN
jgi:predicted DNA-binding mobile mystery protein A